ncbi:MAG: hypothetical protein GMKNLPBB_01388 [Myxococcota bacterium]|nr:hypothetical protein [Myxococcota bacterium]
MVVERKELIATIYYTFNHFDEANRRYADLALAHPEHKLAEKATNLFLDSFNLVQDWEGLNKKAREFLANKKLVENKPTLQTQLKKVIEESAFKLVEAYEKKEQYAEAGKRYEGFHKEFPSSYLGSRALFNAAANYEKSKDPVKAVEVRARLIEQYKDSKDSVDKDIVKKSFFAVAFTYDKMANFEKAALYYEQFADKYPDDERSKEALLRAGLYRESLGMHKESLSSRDIYLKRAARNNSYAKESCYVRFARAETWERLGDMKEAEAAYNAYINSCRQDNPDRALKTQLMLAKRKAKWDDQKKALLAIMKQYEELNKKGVKLTFGAVAAAEARYLLAMESFNKYKEVRINGANKNTLAASFKSKSTAMDTTVKEMTEVVKLGQGEWAVAALYIIGTSFREFAEEVKKLPAPKELASRPDLVDMYKFEVEQEYVNPLREKAALFFASCVKKSNELDVYNDSTKKCLNELHQAKPADFPPQYELVAERGFASELVEPRPFLLETREDREAREKAEREAARKAEEAAAEAEAAPAEAPKEGDAGKADKPTTESNESAEPDAGAGGKGKGKGGKKKKNK